MTAMRCLASRDQAMACRFNFESSRRLYVLATCDGDFFARAAAAGRVSRGTDFPEPAVGDERGVFDLAVIFASGGSVLPDEANILFVWRFCGVGVWGTRGDGRSTPAGRGETLVPERAF